MRSEVYSAYPLEFAEPERIRATNCRDDMAERKTLVFTHRIRDLTMFRTVACTQAGALRGAWRARLRTQSDECCAVVTR